VAITGADGSYAPHLRPTPGAAPGANFTLRVVLGRLDLERQGMIASEAYLPLILRSR
jgi:hypothetical protein